MFFHVVLIRLLSSAPHARVVLSSPGPPSSVLTNKGRVEVEKHAKIELFNFLRGINLNKLDQSMLNRKNEAEHVFF